ncbi:transketolase [Prolixibacteraceae bacterium Z1-6]|uniref:Transketolase n=1 Tax=Draconibacterium aestuarii TaxID=2998507 RepID=A0A9X3F7S9_9BACT|nr:transketolase [Prolixibacteraceae bacterium Z1-6]
MTKRTEHLTAMATQLRRDVVNTIYYAGDGHPGPCMSIADILAVLYFDILKLDPENPKWVGRDRFILSKGHACPVYYAALARRGYLPPAELKTLRSLNSRLQGHPDQKLTPGVDATSGSLGHGLPQGCGMALAARRRGDETLTFVLTGDGELNEGLVWEAAMNIAKYKLHNLIAIIDNNGKQSGGTVEVISGLYNLPEKWRAFGWYTVEIDGHDIELLTLALENAAKRGRASREEREGMIILHGMPAPHPDQPVIFVAKTVKGKGVPYMEGNNAWHKRVPTDEERELAMSILGGKDLE